MINQRAVTDLVKEHLRSGPNKAVVSSELYVVMAELRGMAAEIAGNDFISMDTFAVLEGVCKDGICPLELDLCKIVDGRAVPLDNMVDLFREQCKSSLTSDNQWITAVLAVSLFDAIAEVGEIYHA